MYEDNLYMSNLFSYLSVEPRRRTKPPAPAITTASTERGIRLEKIGFQYPGQEGWAVRDVSLYIAPGESLALVGQNGSGKTTLIKLLTGLYEPTEGRILLDGKDLRDYDRDELRKRMGVIFQDFNRYQLALKENVGVGSVDHLEENDRIERAIERGGAEEIVAGLKDKADTQLGRQFRFDGVELSGGQWQRIALARAFMREEADVLVLDEPTAALDAEAEQAVFERFHALAEGRTTILVSHRFPTVRSADRIVVLAGGRVEDEGNARCVAGSRRAVCAPLQTAGAGLSLKRTRPPDKRPTPMIEWTAPRARVISVIHADSATLPFYGISAQFWWLRGRLARPDRAQRRQRRCGCGHPPRYECRRWRACDRFRPRLRHGCRRRSGHRRPRHGRPRHRHGFDARDHLRNCELSSRHLIAQAPVPTKRDDERSAHRMDHRRDGLADDSYRAHHNWRVEHGDAWLRRVFHIDDRRERSVRAA
jgi:ABC-type multidrug transport system ATPase subunit